MFVKFAMLAGLRSRELFNLTWDDVDFDRGIMTLGDPQGRQEPDYSPLQPRSRCTPAVGCVFHIRFPGKDGQQRTDFKGPWGRIRKAAGPPEGFRFHGLRHHYASALVSNGVDLAIVRELMTHKNIQTTLRYAHLAPDAVQAVASKAEEILRPGANGRLSS